MQGGYHRGPILDDPGFDALAHVVGEQPPGVWLCRQPRVLGGAAAERLRLLVGAVVTACGTSEVDGALSVDVWELRQIDGMQAYFGRVEVTGETILLSPGGERPPIPLDDVPNDLRRSGGRKAWVAGLWMGGAFSVRSFGVLPAP